MGRAYFFTIELPPLDTFVADRIGLKINDIPQGILRLLMQPDLCRKNRQNFGRKRNNSGSRFCYRPSSRSKFTIKTKKKVSKMAVYFSKNELGRELGR